MTGEGTSTGSRIPAVAPRRSLRGRGGLRSDPASRLALWVAFVAVHAALTFLGVVVLPGESFHDLELYRWWVELVRAGGPATVLGSGWVYPAGALLPMILAGIGGTGSTAGYALGWCAMVTALDAAALVALTRRGRAAGAWWWIAFLALLGPVALGRLDAVVAPLAVIALALAARSPAHARVASALLSIGAWIKVAPGALLLPLVAARRRPLRDVVAPAAGVTMLVVVTVWASGTLDHLLDFLTDQGSRGLQIEAVGGTGWMVARFFSRHVSVVLNQELTTYEVTGPGTAVAGRLLDVALVAAVAAIGLALLAARRRGVADLVLLPGALAMMVALFVTDKVGSPQYLTWVAAPIAVGLSRSALPTFPRPTGRLRAAGAAWRVLPPWLRAASTIALGAAALTQMIFPWGYDALLRGVPLLTIALVLRNALLLALLAAALLGVTSVLRRGPDAASASGRPLASAEPRGDLLGDELEMLEVGQVEDLEVDPLGPELGERP